MFTLLDEKKAREFWEQEIREEGRKEGEEKGEDKANINSIQKIMKKMKLSSKGAMDFLDISAEDQKRYAPLLKEVP